MENYHIGFFVDGFTLKKVNEYYRYYHPYRSRIDFRGLKNWAKFEALQVFKPKKNVSWESHYYHPYQDPKKRAWHSPGIMRFEQQILDAGMQVHYCENYRDGFTMPNMSLMEDAVVFSTYHRVNAVVLLTTQGQFSALPERVKAYNVPVLLLGWNFSYPKDSQWVYWKTDVRLRENSAYYIAMERVVADLSARDPLRMGIFQNDKFLVRNYVRRSETDKLTFKLFS